MINKVDDFHDPILFSHTGFVYNTSQRALATNEIFSFGIRRPWLQRTASSLFRAVSEVDIKQIKLIHKSMQSKSAAKDKLNKIEFCTLLRIYGEENFFSLFSEQSIVYENILERRMQGMVNEIDEQTLNQKYRFLQYVLERPTPVHMNSTVRGPNICHLPILKQSLAFNVNRNQPGADPATIRIFRIASHLDLYLTDFIDCMEDFMKILEAIPENEYSSLVNKLEENMFTLGINEAIMEENGKIRTFIKTSASIDFSTPELGLKHGQKHEEVKCEVKVKVIPLA